MFHRVTIVCSIILVNPYLVIAGQKLNPHTGKPDYCATITEEDGSPTATACQGIEVSNGTLTDDGDGNFSLSTVGGGSGDSVTVNGSAVDTTANFLDGDVDWTLVDGGAGGPDDVTATLACSGCIDATDLGADSVGSSEIIESADVTIHDLVLSGAGPDLQWVVTSGDTWHAGAELGVNGGVWLLSNTTDSTHLLRFDGLGNAYLPQLLNCDTLDTTAEGRLKCGTDATGAGGGDAITVNSSAATDPDFANGDIDWTLSGGNSITATPECTGCINATDMAADSVGASEVIESESYTMANIALAGTGPDLTLVPTGGDTFHLGAERTNGLDVAFFSNATEGVHYLEFENAHVVNLGSVGVPFLRLRTDGTGNGEVVLPNDSVGHTELDTADDPADGEALTFQSSSGRMVWAPGSGGNSFETISTPAGTSPVADTSTDTLTLTETGALVLTGDAGTDTIDITFAAGGLTATELGTDSVSADELNATGVEAELEAALDIDGEVSSTGMATTVLDETGISLTSLTVGALLGVDSIDATGAVDMDYGSADVTDHAFVSDGGTITLDGSATIEDDLIIGSDLSARVNLDGNADEIQLLVQGHSTQTTNLMTLETSAGTDELTLTNAGVLTATGAITAGGTAQSTITEGLVVNNGSGTDEDDDLTVNVSGGAYEIDAGAATFTSTANSFGWSVVAGADTACTTTCTSACVFGVNTASLTADIVDCADATADECLCAGAN